MKRAYLIEMSVLKDYWKQLAPLGLFVGAMIAVGTQSGAVVACVLPMMFLMMGCMAASAYDEANNWGLFRLTLPVCRRDVVLGRAAVVLTMGLFGCVIGMLIFLALGLLASVLPLPEDFAIALELSRENVSAAVFATACCLALGSLVAAVSMPVYFRFGQTRATQFLPMLLVVLTLGGSWIAGEVLSMSGVLASDVVAALTDLLAFIETPTGVVASFAVALVFAVAVLTLSAAVSCKLYEGREL